MKQADRMSEESLLFAEIREAVEPDGSILELHLDDYVHQVVHPEYNSLDLKFATKSSQPQSSLDKTGLPHFHASVLGMATTYFKKTYQNNPKEFDLETALHQIGHMFTDSTSSANLLSKKLQLQDLKSELDQINQIKIQKLALQRRKMKLLGMASFGFFSAQLVFGYHFIFNIEWLGWDLVEPMTYTIS